MRSLCAAALLVAGCGTDDPTPEQQFHELEARVATECGTYQANYPLEEDVIPLHLCGEQPNVGCVNDAVGGSAVAHLEFVYLSAGPVPLMREQHYFAADGKVIWISYFEVGLDDPAWYEQNCGSVATESYDVDGLTCWRFAVSDCVKR